jgi:DNA-binding SARP family transcriptional activator
VSVRLLGPVRVEVHGRPLTVDTRKAIALLAYLAVTARPASRDTLAALLWPGSGSGEARGAFRRTLSVLNAALGGVGLAIDRTAVAFGGDGIEVDVRAFRVALARARDHGHDPDDSCPTCLAALDEAARLDRGDFMAGFALRDSETFDEWQLAQGEAHRRDLAGALERLARGRLAAGTWESAMTAGRRWLELDPLHEPAHRLLMTALARAGEQAAAIRQYRDCVRLLDAELGVAPLAETTELYESIRAGRLVPDARGIAVARARAAPDGEVQPAELPTALPLVGRGAALDAILAAHRSCGPDGRLVVVEGEPGIGRSRVAAAAAEAVRSLGGPVVEARAYAGEATIAFGPVVELLKVGLGRADAPDRLRNVRPDLLDEVARLVPLTAMPAARSQRRGVTKPTGAADPFGRVRLFDGLAAVVDALVAGPVAGLVTVDDLHLADASTRDFVAYLARRMRGRPFVLLLTWRREELSDDDVDRVLGSAVGENQAIRLPLDRLDRGEVDRLVAAALGPATTEDVRAAYFAESEGLPLYLAEALAAPAPIAGAIPGGVLSLLRARIGSVGEIAGQVVAAAAVIGRSFDLDTVQRASGRSEEEAIVGLEELVHRGLVREVGAANGGEVRYDFTHGRLRDVAYELLGLARRRLLHRRVAEALEGQARAGRDGSGRWPLIAYHERMAGRSAEAAEAHRRAGELARAVFANREAREHLEAALALGHPATIDLHEALGDVLTMLGDYAGAIAQLESAAALAGPDRVATIEHRLARVHARRGDWARADSHAVAALAASPANGASRSAILADRSAIADRSGDSAAADRLSREALALAEAADDPPGIARSLDIIGILDRRRGDLDSASAHLERAVAVAATTGDLGLRAASLNSLALVRAATGDREAALALTGEALALCSRQGDRHRQAALENNLADLFQAGGHRDEAMEHLKRAVSIFAEIGGHPGELEPEIWKLVEW